MIVQNIVQLKEVDFMIKTLPISEAREQLRALVEQADRTMARVIITRNGKPEAVLVGYSEYESWVETLDVLADSEEMAAIETGLEEVRAGQVVSAEEAYREALTSRDRVFDALINLGVGGLTGPEATVLHRLAMGAQEKEIAHALHLAPKKVQAIKLSIMQKLGLTGEVEKRHDTAQKRKAVKVGG